MYGPKDNEFALKMVENVKTAFSKLLKNSDWMDEYTKKGAFKKLGRFSIN